MYGYLQLALTGLLPVAASAVFFLADRKLDSRGEHSKTYRILRQIIIGTVFGGIAVFGTECGVPIKGAMLNTRDAAVLCAGLFFGGPAGVIAGVIGGVERWIAVAWGVGSYTRAACSISTVFAGFYAAFLRSRTFEHRRPDWTLALATGTVIEVFHVTMVFITHLRDVPGALAVVQAVTFPMISANALSVTAVSVLLTLLSGESLRLQKGSVRISQQIQRRLFMYVTIAFLVTIGFIQALQNGMTEANAEKLLELGIGDAVQEISDATDRALLAVTETIAARAFDEDLEILADRYGVAEINIVDENGIVVRSTDERFEGYDMASADQSAAFLVLLEGRKTFVQVFGEIGYDQRTLRKYAGVAIGDGFVQVGYDAAELRGEKDTEVAAAAVNRHIGEGGFLVVQTMGGKVVSESAEHAGEKPGFSGINAIRQHGAGKLYRAEVYGIDCYCMAETAESYYILGAIPVQEIVTARDVMLYVTGFMEILVFAVLFLRIYHMIRSSVVDNIRKVNGTLRKITAGDLDTEADVRSCREFASLSDGINTTVDTLKDYIAEAAARIDADLALAKQIQYAALPGIFPTYPQRHEFDIYAAMDAAKEVGGDFYDFYFTQENILNFLVADVSGKGIPAAMFMMRAKTQLKSLTESGAPAEEVFRQACVRLCEGNSESMFVTVWQGQLNLTTGDVKYVSAGHNPPLVKHGEDGFAYVKGRCGLALGLMPKAKYRTAELHLDPGDTLFLYTDGVTEAVNAAEELYGEERLAAALDAAAGESVRDLCVKIRMDIDHFAGAAPQFDDITLLALRYNGPREQKNEGPAVQE